MRPRLLVPALLVIAAGTILFPLLRNAGDAPPVRPPLPPFAFGNALNLAAPPAIAYRPDLLADPVERTVERLLWGTSEVVQFTQAHLPDDREHLRRVVERRLDELAPGMSLGARRLLEVLGLIGTAECIPPLLRFAQQEPDYLQVVAIQALASCPPDPRVLDALAVLSQHPSAQIAGAARQAAINRRDTWNVAQIQDFLAGQEGETARLLIHEIGRRGIQGAADAVAAPRFLHAESLVLRHAAIGALLRLRDPRGYQEAEVELGCGDSRRVLSVLTSFRDAGMLPPLEACRRLAAGTDPDVRLALARALRASDGEDAAQGEVAIHLLEGLADTEDPALHMAAVASLYSRGHVRHLARFRQALATAHGAELKEAVKFLCEQLRDAASLPALRQRLAQELEPADQVDLLFGLRFVGGAEDVSRFVEPMRRAGSAEDRVAGAQRPVSDFATLYVQTLGAAAATALRAGLEESTALRPRLCFLDAIRGTAGAAPELLEPVARLIQDGSAPLELRLAAVDSLPFFWSPERGAQVRAWSDAVDRREVATRLLAVFVSYF